MSLSELPPELLLMVVGSFPSEKTINYLTRTCRSYFSHLDPFLYCYHVRKGDVSTWKYAAVNNHPEVVRKLLDAGASIYDSTMWHVSELYIGPHPNHPLIIATVHNHPSVVDAVEHFGCRFHNPLPMGRAPFLYTLDHTRVELPAEQILQRIPRTLSLLFRHGADPARAAALQRAVSVESWLTARFLIARGGGGAHCHQERRYHPEVQAALDRALANHDFEGVMALLEVEGLEV
ncbi:hypothetical protein BO82DRAFT_362541 [Aspergillus uvarum CBS 121591]|uniref:F-box domain-containing protein n=1 Tax=Aspergillus uvarum CBS 121591 TaxID=1448315 RepID=A0A319CGQ1_9EURO|nr:hypothetical protein BO82DRAFT_362541 [Aspergillus uvarum CBS 121591]PYH84404.1 hypothetical protein BO82DRAFT_362541 [Aspergillus uvarum CBS 121591]